MAQLLTDLLEAGLIEKLDGNDDRFASMEKASATIAAALHTKPRLIISAVLAGLDPDVPSADPAIERAQAALVSHWKAMKSIHIDPPTKLLRAILLDACVQAAEDKNAAILWLTAADTWPWMRLGREEACLRRALENTAQKSEQLVMSVRVPSSDRLPPTKTAPKQMQIAKAAANTTYRVNRDELLKKIGASAGPHFQGQQQQPGWNPHWSSTQGHWSWEFSTRMRDLLADELDALAASVTGNQPAFVGSINEALLASSKSLTDGIAEQEKFINASLAAIQHQRGLESSQLQSLWWAEALYSPSLRRGYRDLPIELAAVVMAGDLLKQGALPTAASVGYLLFETVHRLPGASFEESRPLVDILRSLRAQRNQLLSDWMQAWEAPPKTGRFSIRDLVVLALSDREWEPDDDIRRAGLPPNMVLSLPKLAQAIFRQEQAVRLSAQEE